MIRKHLLGKLYLAAALLLVFTGVIVGISIERQMRTNALADIRDDLERAARLMANLHPEGIGDPSLPTDIRLMSRSLSNRLSVFDAEARLLLDSEQHVVPGEPHADRPEIIQAKRTGSGHATRFSTTVGQDLVYVAIRTDTGYMRAAKPVTEIERRLQGLRWTVLLATGLAILIALPLGFLLARRLTRPLAAMTRTAQAIAEGDYERRMQVTREDEIGDLAQAFDAMAQQLGNRVAAVDGERLKLESIIGSMVEGLIAVDEDEHILHLNAAAERLLGKTSAEAIGRPLYEMCRHAEVTEALGQVLRQRQRIHREFTVIGPAQTQHFQIQADAIQVAEGKTEGAVALLLDITELRRLEAIRRDFVANVSHELKTPLTAIIGLVETILGDRGMPTDTRERFLNRIAKQGERLSLLVTDLLTLSRLESPESSMQEDLVDFTKVIQASCSTLQPTAQDRGITLEWFLPKRSVPVNGDAEFLRQAVDNLVDNAIKYTPGDGRVSVELDDRGRDITLQVSDTGIGISAADKERIFERFYRVDKARSRQVGGTGLGLAIVKHIALSHGGSVSVDSTLGSGTTFSLHLPRPR